MKRTKLITAALFSLSLSSLTFASASAAEDPTAAWPSIASDLNKRVEHQVNQQIEHAAGQQVIRQLFRIRSNANQYAGQSQADDATQARQAATDSAKLAQN